MRRFKALPLLFLLGCGEVETGVHVVVPWQSPITCANRTALLDMTATLKIGGHPDCSLNVSQSDLTVSGTCPDISAQTVRPLMLLYALPRSPQPEALLAVNIGFANLCDDALPDADTVPINLANDGQNSTLIFQAGAVAAMPGGAPPPSCNDRLDEATRWAKDQLVEDFGNFDPLDLSDNGISNLEEACAGTL